MNPNPNLHAHHAKYFAHLLTLRQGANGDDPLAQTLYDAKVDLNPHQIEAALFAITNPLSKGVLLADEVGLGKTIEAGIVLCQFWAERKRNLLVVCPASLRKQWAMELQEKFSLAAMVLDSKIVRDNERMGCNVWDEPTIKIISYAFAHKMRDTIRQKHWDLAVFDEAHKLRNSYRESNIMGQSIRMALEGVRKILLTATPLQNSLDELYGLATLIDPMMFGDIKGFRSQYSHVGGNIAELKYRLAQFSKRTLRADVKEYIQYTERRALTRPFTPSDDEHGLYEAVSAFLRRVDGYAIPHQQRHLIELIVRKLLASSTIAIADTLQGMLNRLQALRLERNDSTPKRPKSANDLLEDALSQAQLDGLIDELDELDEASILSDIDGAEVETTAKFADKIDYAKLDDEIEELSRLLNMANQIQSDSKSHALLQALNVGFEQMATVKTAHKPARKALIFTESRRTQQYLFEFLSTNGYEHEVVLFSGTNNTPQAKAIYEAWLVNNKHSDKVSGSRDIDIRTALVEYFRDTATVMIATEAAAEGVNMQFCSLVVNYDLPWNPQRVEQRIGRCHRYGQKHDVVVINFLNERNEVDRRVLELLTEKFKLFDGVFGASDEIIGVLESGIDFENRILKIYQECRTHEQIQSAFKMLQDEMQSSIEARMIDTQNALMNHFDVDVHERLQGRLAQTQAQLDKFERWFWRLSRWMLAKNATFDDQLLTFDVTNPPALAVVAGRYHFKRKMTAIPADEHLYRLAHPLGEFVLESAKNLSTPTVELTFDVSHFSGARLFAIEKLKGHSGYLTLSKLTLTNDVDVEEHLLFSAFDSNGHNLDIDTCEKLFWCDVTDFTPVELPAEIEQRLIAENMQFQNATTHKSMEHNNRHFQIAAEKLAKWANDSIKALDKGMEDTKNSIAQYERAARQATTLQEQADFQEKIQTLEAKLRRQRRDIFAAEDEIKDRRDTLQSQLHQKLKQASICENLFHIAWSVA